MKWIVVGLALSALPAHAESATSTMKRLVGQSIQRMMAKAGPPSNAFDMPDGARAFQWSMSADRATPQTITRDGSITPGFLGNSVDWTSREHITGGTITTVTCLFTLYTMWNEAGSYWQIIGFEKPRQGCEFRPN